MVLCVVLSSLILLMHLAISVCLQTCVCKTEKLHLEFWKLFWSNQNFEFLCWNHLLSNYLTFPFAKELACIIFQVRELWELFGVVCMKDVDLPSYVQGVSPLGSTHGAWPSHGNPPVMRVSCKTLLKKGSCPWNLVCEILFQRNFGWLS